MALSTAMYTRFVSVGIFHIGFTIWMYGLWIDLMMAQWVETCFQIYSLLINYLLCSDWIKQSFSWDLFWI